MKKLAKLALTVFIPIVLGIVCNVFGARAKNTVLSLIGTYMFTVGVPVVMFALVVIGLILIITGKLQTGDPTLNLHPEKPQDTERPAADVEAEKEREAQEIANVNSSYGHESQLRQDEFMMRHVANNYANATKKEKILGWLFFAYLMTVFFLCMVFIFLKITVGVIVCFSLFTGTILIALVVKKILERTSMRKKYQNADSQTVQTGKVRSCVMSSMTSTGGGSDDYNRTTRIKKVIYRVVIGTEENAVYTAYTKNYYVSGEQIKFVPIGKTRASIIEEPEEKG